MKIHSCGCCHILSFHPHPLCVWIPLNFLIFSVYLHTDISNEELPLDNCPLGIYIIRIPGLCTKLSVSSGHDTPGSIVFVSYEKIRYTHKSSEQHSFEWYRRNVLLPFIELCCTKYHGWTTCIEIPNDLTTYCWCYGVNV